MIDIDFASETERYKIALLLDTYGNLLTSKQKETLELYFQEDLSLAEISDLKEISRQGVHSFIICGVNALYAADRKLKFIDKIKEYEKEIERLKNN